MQVGTVVKRASDHGTRGWTLRCIYMTQKGGSRTRVLDRTRVLRTRQLLTGSEPASVELCFCLRVDAEPISNAGFVSTVFKRVARTGNVLQYFIVQGWQV